MSIAEETIDFLFTAQLQVDEQWSYLLPTGFTWWADQNGRYGVNVLGVIEVVA